MALSSRSRSSTLRSLCLIFWLLGGCAGTGLPQPADGPRATPTAALSPIQDLQQRALLLLMADQRRFEPFTVETALQGDAARRQELAATLGRVGDPRGVTYLGQLAADRDPEVRRTAVFALGELELERVDAERAARSLLLVAVEDDREAAALAVEALAKLGVSVTEVVAALTRAELPEEERWARLLPALYRFDEEAMPPLAAAGLAALDGGDRSSTEPDGVASSSGTTATQSTASPSTTPAPPDLSTSLTAPAGTDPAAARAALRRRAAFALSRTPRPESLLRLRALLDDADPRIRAWAARALGLTGEATDLPALRTVTASDPDSGPRIQALRAAAGLAERAGEEGSGEPRGSAEGWRRTILGLLDHPDPLVRLEALDRAAPWLEEPGSATGGLIAALTDRVRTALDAASTSAASTAGSSNDAVATVKSTDHGVRVALAEGAAALAALAQGAPSILSEPGDGNLLRAAAGSADLLRSASATAIGQIAGPTSLTGADSWRDLLGELLADPAPAVRSAAATALLARAATHLPKPAPTSAAAAGGDQPPPPTAALPLTAAEVAAEEAARSLALRLLRHSDPGVGAVAFGWLEEHPVVPYVDLTQILQRALAGGALELRLAAVPALAARAEAEARERGGVVTVLEKLASREVDSDATWLVRRAVGEALARLDRPVPPAGHPRGRRTPLIYQQIAQRTTRPRLVEVETEAGTLRLRLDCPRAPMTCLNFLQLAGQGIFDGTPFHRVVPDFVIQGGDPRGDGSGGPGYAIRDEINRRRYVRGTLGMALSGPDTGGSQFFITHVPQPHLDGGYTAFGEVVAGGEVLDRVTRGTRVLAVREVDG